MCSIREHFCTVEEIQTSDFERVSKTKTFIDKTLFIRDFLHNPANRSFTHIVLTYPRKFGKSTNLDMLRRFVEMNLDENTGQIKPAKQSSDFQLFTKRNLSIMQYPEIFDNHFQKYPVINLNFRGIIKECSNETLAALKHVIYRCYAKYGWLWRLLKHEYISPDTHSYYENITQHEKNDFELGQRILSNEIILKDIAIALKVLARKLNRHFGRKVIIFIDEFDAMMLDAMTSQSRKVTVAGANDLMKSVLLDIMKFKTGHEFVAYAFITGISEAPVQTFYCKLRHIQYYSIFTENPLTPYFGFTKDEMRILYARYDIPEEQRQQINNYYDGYRISHKYPHIFNTFSIVSYFHSDQTLTGYWARTTAIAQFYGYLRIDYIRNRVFDLYFRGGTFIEQIHPNFRDGEFMGNLKALFYSQDCQSRSRSKYENIIPKLFFKILWEGGYLTKTRENRFYKIPNKEIEENFKHLLHFYYGTEEKFNEYAKHWITNTPTSTLSTPA